MESLDIGLVAPHAEWTVDVPGYARYKPIEVSYELKKLEQPGVYVVKVTDQEHLQATTLALTSDIEAIVRTSREYMLIFRPGYEDRQGNAPGDRAGLRAVGVQPPVANPAGGQDLLAKPGNNLKQIQRLQERDKSPESDKAKGRTGWPVPLRLRPAFLMPYSIVGEPPRADPRGTAPFSYSRFPRPFTEMTEHLSDRGGRVYELSMPQFVIPSGSLHGSRSYQVIIRARNQLGTFPRATFSAHSLSWGWRGRSSGLS